MSRFLLSLLLSLGLLLPFVAPANAAEELVTISEPAEATAWSYSPATITVPVGTTVVWKNSGREVHGVTSQDQLFDSRLLDPGKSWSYTFDTPGVYRYFCVPHPWMKGTVVVTAGDGSRRGNATLGPSAGNSQPPPPPDEREGDP